MSPTDKNQTKPAKVTPNKTVADYCERIDLRELGYNEQALIVLCALDDKTARQVESLYWYGVVTTHLTGPSDFLRLMRMAKALGMGKESLYVFRLFRQIGIIRVLDTQNLTVEFDTSTINDGGWENIIADLKQAWIKSYGELNKTNEIYKAEQQGFPIEIVRGAMMELVSD